jgi:prepilin-type N-terminal cleavage/methylation domain-containing protein
MLLLEIGINIWAPLSCQAIYDRRKARIAPKFHRQSVNAPDRKRCRGFTLIEVALAATILVVSFVGLIEALAIGSEMLDTASKQTLASQIVSAEADYVRTQSWSAVQGLPSTSPDFLGNYAEFYGSDLASLAGHSLKFSRQVHSPDPHSDLRQMTLTVSWTGITGRSHSRSCDIYVGKNGLRISYRTP